MLRFLFPRLTPPEGRGAALFAAVSAEARQPHWYVAGEVPDTVDGRFNVLATVAALVVVQLEHRGVGAHATSVALVERFIEAMDAEHRQMGIGDPTVGRTVRKLTGSLGRRVELWRSAVDHEQEWTAAVSASLFRREPQTKEAIDHCLRELRKLWSRLKTAADAQLAKGRI